MSLYQNINRAIKNEDYEFLNSHYDLFTIDDQNDAFQAAVEYGRFHIIDLFLEKKFHIKPYSYPFKNFVQEYDRPDMVQKLMAYGCNFDYQNNEELVVATTYHNYKLASYFLNKIDAYDAAAVIDAMKALMSNINDIEDYEKVSSLYQEFTTKVSKENIHSLIEHLVDDECKRLHIYLYIEHIEKDSTIKKTLQKI